jgi:hypothetical protein
MRAVAAIGRTKELIWEISSPCVACRNTDITFTSFRQNRTKALANNYKEIPACLQVILEIKSVFYILFIFRLYSFAESFRPFRPVSLKTSLIERFSDIGGKSVIEEKVMKNAKKLVVTVE